MPFLGKLRVEVEVQVLAHVLAQLGHLLEQRFLLLRAPVLEKRTALETRKRVRQFSRDVDEELMWIDEKRAVCQLPMPLEVAAGAAAGAAGAVGGGDA